MSAHLVYGPILPGGAQQQAGGPPFDPAAGFPWQEQPGQEQSLAARWYQPDTEAWTPIPGLTVASVAAQAGLWQDASPQQDRSIQPVWYGPEDDATGFVPRAITTASVAAQAALSPEQPGQERSIWPLWWRPDDPTEAIYPILPPPPFDPATGFPWLLYDELPARRDFSPDAIEAQFAGPLTSWLFTTSAPGGGGTATPAVLIDATSGDVFLSIGGNLIVPA